MKNLLPIFIFSVISIKALSQHSQLTVSEDFKIVEKEYQDETIAHSVYHNNCFFSATNSGIGSNYKWAFTKLYDLKYAVTISKFDKNMNKVKDFVLENGEKAFWTADSKHLMWSSGIYGFKDEVTLYDNTFQPYGAIFIMNADGTDKRQLTDSPWEDSMPVFAP